MRDPETAGSIAGEEGAEREDERREWRRKALIALIALLLLLLCAIATIADVWVERGPSRTVVFASDLACLRCHTELVPAFSKASVHQPFLKQECTVCHTRHGKQVTRTTYGGSSTQWERARTFLEWLPLRWVFSAYDSIAGATASVRGGEIVSTGASGTVSTPSTLTAPADELCWLCHGDLGQQKAMTYQHRPFAENHCSDCHDPHASDHAFLLKADERDLCVSCHPVATDLAKSDQHSPFQGRLCTTCHQPHASGFKGILVARQRDLCFSCHPNVAMLAGKAVQHQPFGGDGCTDCHRPHSADYAKLLQTPQPELCYQCHPAVRRDFLKPSSHPVGTWTLLCAECHDPHAADYKALLVTNSNDLCFGCHKTPQRTVYETSGHSGQPCVSCHTPHGSAYAPILRQPDPTLCLTCHPDYQGTNKHPARPAYYDVHSHKALGCASTCHNPHGTVFTKMVTYPYRRDGLCMECHAGVGVYF